MPTGVDYDLCSRSQLCLRPRPVCITPFSLPRTPLPCRKALLDEGLLPRP